MDILRRWKLETMAQLQADIEHTLRRYEAQCLEAAAVAPQEWRAFWRAEAHSASLLRRSLMRKAQMFLDFAGGHDVETLTHLKTGEAHEDQ